MTPDQSVGSDPYTEAVFREYFDNLLPAIKSLSTPEIFSIKSAFKLAVGAHHEQERKTVDKYHISHVVATTLILRNECNIKDATVLKGALLHDTVEDSTFFGDPTQMSYNGWIEYSRGLLKEKNVIDPTIDIVLALTKPQVNGLDIKDKTEARNRYYDQLKKAAPEVLLIKMADRLHNLRTQYETAPEDKERKIKETRVEYLQIFELARESYPKETEYLLSQINQELQKLEGDEGGLVGDNITGVIFEPLVNSA